AYAGKGGLLALKEDKKTGDQVITAINRQHPLYDQYNLVTSHGSCVETAGCSAALQQIREAGFAYVKAAGLGEKSCDPQSLQLDVLLCDALFHGVRIQRGAQSLIKKGAVPAISVSVVKRQGSKKVTRVVGMEAFLVSPEELAAESQHKFAASSSVNELPGKSGGVEVVVQGSVAEQMAALLTDRYGVPKKYISVKTEA
ncbi:hypothetical protein QJQ45_023703, partial [Haematococcus lacustris]